MVSEGVRVAKKRLVLLKKPGARIPYRPVEKLFARVRVQIYA